ncbi:MAG TPA: hypothetical protein VF414_15165, partial [Thermoanaerobaculia bacterium]
MDARALAHEPAAFPMVRALARMHELVALVARSGELLWQSPRLVELSRGSGFPGSHWLETLVDPRSPDLDARLESAGGLSGEPVELRRQGGRPLPVRVSAVQLGP